MSIPTVIPPSRDGDKNEYVNANAYQTRWFDRNRKVVFVNGMLNSASDHVDAALALSMLQMCRVIGIYNRSRVADERLLSTPRAVVEDLIQCLGDKVQWDMPNATDRALVNLNTWFQNNVGNPANAVRFVEFWLARNPAALTLFQHIRSHGQQPLTIFAHSQGNLITSNALTAISLLNPNGLSRITVNSYASPAVFWPSGFTHNRYAYTLDLVPLVAGVGNSLSLNTSTIGGLSGVASHGFEHYRRDDATFVVNSFRWGMLRMTASLDEAGIARALDRMGTNMPRIYNIFRRLDDAHGFDVDDVAVAYINRIKNKSSTMNAIKAHTQLRALLVRSMDEGWTSSEEQTAINLLNA